MFVDRPKPGTKLPPGHSPHGTRKQTSKLFSVCHGSDINNHPPSPNTFKIVHPPDNRSIKIALSQPSQPKFELELRKIQSPCIRIIRFFQRTNYFQKVFLARKKVHQANYPPLSYDSVGDQSVAMKGIYPFGTKKVWECVSMVIPISYIYTSAMFKRMIKIPWNMETHFHPTRNIHEPVTVPPIQFQA